MCLAISDSPRTIFPSAVAPHTFSTCAISGFAPGSSAARISTWSVSRARSCHWLLGDDPGDHCVVAIETLGGICGAHLHGECCHCLAFFAPEVRWIRHRETFQHKFLCELNFEGKQKII